MGKRIVADMKSQLAFHRMCHAEPRVWNREYVRANHTGREIMNSLKRIRARNSYATVRKLVNDEKIPADHVRKVARVSHMFGAQFPYRSTYSWFEESLALVEIDNALAGVSEEECARLLLIESV